MVGGEDSRNRREQTIFSLKNSLQGESRKRRGSHLRTIPTHGPPYSQCASSCAPACKQGKCPAKDDGRPLNDGPRRRRKTSGEVRASRPGLSAFGCAGL